MANIISWLWDQGKRAFRKLTGGGSLSDNTVQGIRDAMPGNLDSFVSSSSSQLLNGEINLNRWLNDFRQELKDVYINQYTLARGGVNAMTQQDWGSLGGQLKRQYDYMQNFTDEIAQGRLSAAQIEQRMKLYFNSATQAFERGKARAAGLPILPQYPGDGRTQCRTNCKCNWEIHDTELGWDCYWRLNPAEHCDDCIRNSREWNPLFVPRF